MKRYRRELTVDNIVIDRGTGIVSLEITKFRPFPVLPGYLEQLCDYLKRLRFLFTVRS